MVLIDGDGMIVSICSLIAGYTNILLQFNENLIRQGIEGGKQAANLLRNSVLEHCSELTDEIEIMAKVCANVIGLTKAMRRDGSLENPDDLRYFTL